MYKFIKKHKSKIAIFCAVFLLVSALPFDKFIVYAESESMNEIKNGSKYYDSDTETFNIPVGKSGTAVVVSASVASLLLTIAVKAGFDFIDSDSLDEFLLNFCGYAPTRDFLLSLKELITTAGSGVITIGRSLIDEFTKLYYNMYSSKKTTYSEVLGLKIPVFGSGYLNSQSYIKQVVLNADPSISTVFSRDIPWDTDVPSHVLMGEKYGLRLANRSGQGVTGISLQETFKMSSGEWSSWSGYVRDWAKGKNMCKVSYAGFQSSPGYTQIRIFIVFYNPGDTISSMEFANLSLPYQPTWEKYFSSPATDVALPVPPDINVPDDSGSSTGDVTVGIPGNMNDLVGKKPSDITSNPSYDVWNPGETISPPAVDNPSVDITPDGDDGGTDSKPDEGGISGLISKIISLIQSILDWLSKFWDSLLNLMKSVLDSALSGIVKLLETIVSVFKTVADWISSFWDTFTSAMGDIFSGITGGIVDILTSIWEWISSFWDSLLDFLTRIFVPSDSYWTDKFKEIESRLFKKIPSIDLNPIKDLAQGETPFKDIYVTIFGQRCLIVRASLINGFIGWAQPIIQGLVAIFLILYNYNQVYHLLRGSSLLGAQNSIDNMKNGKVGGR